jgi:hypothetical protein
MPAMTSPAGGDPRSTAPEEPPAAIPVHHDLAHEASVNVFSSDWPAQAADRIVDAVDTVRDRTTGTAQTAARGVVYGLLAVVAGIVVLVLVTIGAIRLLDVLVDHFIPWGHIWLPYLILGCVFLLVGAIVFRRRRRA